MESQYGAFILVIISSDGYRNLQEGNIKMDLQQVGGWGTDWIDVAQDRDSWLALMNVAMKLQVPQNVENFLTS